MPGKQGVSAGKEVGAFSRPGERNALARRLAHRPFQLFEDQSISHALRASQLDPLHGIATGRQTSRREGPEALHTARSWAAIRCMC
jgi:hypothetical protein